MPEPYDTSARKQKPLWHPLRAIAVHPRMQQIFSIDLRALAALRIGIGALLLLNLYNRALWLTAHYSDRGILPRSFLIPHDANDCSISAYIMNGSPKFVMALFIVQALFAFLLLIGYRTRLATLVSWFLLLSLHNRNPWVLQGGDFVLLLTLFWSLFLPLGARASVDSLARDPDEKLPTTVSNLPSAALLLQVVFIYFFTGLLKHGPSWNVDGTAVYYALSYEHFTASLGHWLKQFDGLTSFATSATLILELYVPALLFMPYRFVWFRTLTTLAFMTFHLALAATMTLGLFSYICLVVWMVFLPTPIWDFLGCTRVAGCAGRYWDASLRKIYTWSSILARWIPVPLPAPGRVGVPAPVNLLCGGLICYVLLINLRSAPGDPLPDVVKSRLLSPLEIYGRTIGISQYWMMFAPNPQSEAGWFVLQAELHDGREIDLYRAIVLDDPSPLTFEEPELISATYPTQRWRKALLQMYRYPARRPHLVPLAAWLRSAWIAKNSGRVGSPKVHPWTIVSMRIHYMLKFTRPHHRTPYRAKLVLYDWDSAGTERWYSKEETDREWRPYVGGIYLGDSQTRP